MWCSVSSRMKIRPNVLHSFSGDSVSQVQAQIFENFNYVLISKAFWFQKLFDFNSFSSWTLQIQSLNTISEHSQAGTQEKDPYYGLSVGKQLSPTTLVDLLYSEQEEIWELHLSLRSCPILSCKEKQRGSGNAQASNLPKKKFWQLEEQFFLSVVLQHFAAITLNKSKSR